MSTTFLKKIEKNFKNAAKPYFMRVSGQKNYVKYASGWKNHKKMIKYDIYDCCHSCSYVPNNGNYMLCN